jgi:hypothetical protein
MASARVRVLILSGDKSSDGKTVYSRINARLSHENSNILPRTQVPSLQAPDATFVGHQELPNAGQL